MYRVSLGRPGPLVARKDPQDPRVRQDHEAPPEFKVLQV